MKKIILLLTFAAIATIPSKITLEDGREIVLHCTDDACVWKSLDNDACYDPVTKRWGPCY